MGRLVLSLCLVTAWVTGAAQTPAGTPSATPSATPPATRSAQRASDLFVGGGSVRVSEPVAGDLIAAGANVDVDDGVAGDALVFGGNVRINAPVGASLYSAGGQLTIESTVGRNARIAGGRVDIGPRGAVSGNVSVAGGEVRLDGPVDGYVQVAAGTVFINAAVGGDVSATGGVVELGPRARIAGRLRYASREELRRDPAAQVNGGIERGMRHEHGHGAGAPARSGGTGRIVLIAGLMVLAAAFVAGLPGFTAGVSTTLRTRSGTSVLVGFAGLVCIPIAAVVLFLTLIGIPVALLLLVLYVALLIVGYVTTGVGVGDWMLARARPQDAPRVAWRAAAAALALLVIVMLGSVPWIGGAFTFAVLIAGIGALLMQVRRLRAGTPAAGQGA